MAFLVDLDSRSRHQLHWAAPGLLKLESGAVLGDLPGDPWLRAEEAAR
ncbi:hypothetical protein [Streptomyces sp. NPDC005573]